MFKFMDRVPAHIRYPGLVLAFLLGSVLSQVVLFRAAFSGQGLQVEDNYYQRALGWDQAQTQRLRLDRAGLTLNAVISPNAIGQTVTLKLLQDGQAPLNLEGMTLELEGFRPQLSKAQFKTTIPAPQAWDQGVRMNTAMTPGVWDLRYTLKMSDGQVYVLTQRQEVASR